MMLSLADRLLARQLLHHKAVIFKPVSDINANAFPAYPNGDRRKRPTSWVSLESFQNLSDFKGLKACRKGFCIMDSLMARIKAADERSGNYAGQHRDMDERDVYIQSGVKRPARINMALSALDRLYRRCDRAAKTLLSKAEYEAGQGFARDYALAGYGHIATQNYMSAGADKMGYCGREADIAQSQLDAKRRFLRASTAIGAGLDKAVIAVCCLDKSLDDVERAENWAMDSGITILKLGLGRLVDFYGTEAGRRQKE